jgi:hypothetical protein
LHTGETGNLQPVDAYLLDLDVTKAIETARIVREALHLEDEQHSAKPRQEGVVIATRKGGGAIVVLEEPGAGTDRARPAYHLVGLNPTQLENASQEEGRREAKAPIASRELAHRSSASASAPPAPGAGRSYRRTIQERTKNARGRTKGLSRRNETQSV